ncbi:uncharacterized protein LOC120182789 [Hibiscus syriacus]|uniref:uncharacterized protein LOC120182789 n=1 Tax=Hibiscus syriacus TaxID=106335 RepID=UPI001923E3A7|nr:uncharacterized protein LOC120182789 [Hibiscus syriacus]
MRIPPIGRWISPAPGVIKLNSVGAIDPITRTAAVGVIARDASGNVLGGLAIPTVGCFEASLVEFHGPAAAVNFSLKEGWQHVFFELDCSVVVTKFNRMEGDASMLGIHMQPIRDNCNAFNSCSVVYAPQDANRVAHNLAKYS